jgi:hypothetical protein
MKPARSYGKLVGNLWDLEAVEKPFDKLRVNGGGTEEWRRFPVRAES